jgi:trimethylamine--corrinoid protein Co-methyltransferase
MTRKYFQFLTDEELKKIHDTSLRILENTGMLIDHQRALQILNDGGAKVDFKNKRVKFTPDLVNKCLQRVPRTIVYGGRNPENDMVLKTGGELYTRGNSGQTSYVDLETGEYRAGKLEDVKQWAILMDALPNINGVGPLHPANVPTTTSDIHSLRALLENQRKHINNQAFTVKNLKYELEMIVAVQGSREEVKKRPLFHNIVCVVSPLYVSEEDVDMLMLADEYGIPSGFADMINVAATGPATLAGTLALGNAEMLGAACLNSILCPGKPQTYFLEPGVTDMSTGALMLGSAENIIMCSALTQIANTLYQLPVETAAMASDWTITEEAVLQKGMNGLMAAYHGASFIFGCGSIDTFMAQSPVQLVIDDEIVGTIRRIIRGLEVDEDRLGLAAVERVGPQGTFITDPHTRKYMRGEYFRPQLFNRDPRTVWFSKGSKNLEQRAREKALRILKEHKVEPLDSHVLKELDLIAKKADQELAK